MSNQYITDIVKSILYTGASQKHLSAAKDHANSL